MKRYIIIQLLIVGAMYLLGIGLLPHLPELVPSHWNISGEADAYINKTLAVFLFPSITLTLTAFLQVFRKIDPRKKNYEQFRTAWGMIQTTITAYFAYLYAFSFYLAMNPEKAIEPFIFVGIGVLLILIGNYLGKVRQNYFIGIKTPWTLDNERVWNKTNRLAGWLFVGAGIIIILEAIVRLWVAPVSFAAIGIAVVIPVIYSYLFYGKEQK
jgi:uncharacterized membrane protein